MFAHSVNHSQQIKEQLLGNNIGLYLEKCDKLIMLQHHFFVGVRVISWIPLFYSITSKLIPTYKHRCAMIELRTG